MHVCSIVKLLPLGTVDDLVHYCTRPMTSCNSASGRPRHLGVIVLTILQTGILLTGTIPWPGYRFPVKAHRRLSTCATTMRIRFICERRRYATMAIGTLSSTGSILSNAFYWYQIFALDSDVVEVQEMFSSHTHMSSYHQPLGVKVDTYEGRGRLSGYDRVGQGRKVYD